MKQLRIQNAQKKPKQNLKGRKHPLRPKKGEAERCDEYLKIEKDKKEKIT